MSMGSWSLRDIPRFSGRLLGRTALACLVVVTVGVSACRADKLDYIERISGGADASAELPLVVAIHGLGGTPESFARLFDGFDTQARLIFPRAPKAWGPGFSWFSFDARMRGDEAGFARALSVPANRIATLVAELRSSRPTRGKPIVTGFSQGGMLAFALAALHGDEFSTVIPVGGLLPAGIELSSGSGERLRVVALHGGADVRVDVAAARSSIARLRAAGFSTSMETFADVGHGVFPPIQRRLLELIGDAIGRGAKNREEPSSSAGRG